MRTGADIEQDQFRVLIPQQTGFCISRQPQRIRSPTWVLIECKSLSNHSCPAETLTIRASVKSWKWALNLLPAMSQSLYTIRKLQQCKFGQSRFIPLRGRGKLALF